MWSDWDNLRSTIRGIVASARGGLPVSQINASFREMTSNDLPLHLYCFTEDVEELLSNMSDDVVVLPRCVAFEQEGGVNAADVDASTKLIRADWSNGGQRPNDTDGIVVVTRKSQDQHLYRTIQQTKSKNPPSKLGGTVPFFARGSAADSSDQLISEFQPSVQICDEMDDDVEAGAATSSGQTEAVAPEEQRKFQPATGELLSAVTSVRAQRREEIPTGRQSVPVGVGGRQSSLAVAKSAQDHIFGDLPEAPQFSTEAKKFMHEAARRRLTATVLGLRFWQKLHALLKKLSDFVEIHTRNPRDYRRLNKSYASPPNLPRLRYAAPPDSWMLVHSLARLWPHVYTEAWDLQRDLGLDGFQYTLPAMINVNLEENRHFLLIFSGKMLPNLIQEWANHWYDATGWCRLQLRSEPRPSNQFKPFSSYSPLNKRGRVNVKNSITILSDDYEKREFEDEMFENFVMPPISPAFKRQLQEDKLSIPTEDLRTMVYFLFVRHFAKDGLVVQLQLREAFQRKYGTQNCPEDIIRNFDRIFSDVMVSYKCWLLVLVTLVCCSPHSIANVQPNPLDTVVYPKLDIDVVLDMELLKAADIEDEYKMAQERRRRGLTNDDAYVPDHQGGGPNSNVPAPTVLVPVDERLTPPSPPEQRTVASSSAPSTSTSTSRWAVSAANFESQQPSSSRSRTGPEVSAGPSRATTGPVPNLRPRNPGRFRVARPTPASAVREQVEDRGNGGVQNEGNNNQNCEVGPPTSGRDVVVQILIKCPGGMRIDTLTEIIERLRAQGEGLSEAVSSELTNIDALINAIQPPVERQYSRAPSQGTGASVGPGWIRLAEFASKPWSADFHCEQQQGQLVSTQIRDVVGEVQNQFATGSEAANNRSSRQLAQPRRNQRSQLDVGATQRMIHHQLQRRPTHPTAVRRQSPSRMENEQHLRIGVENGRRRINFGKDMLERNAVKQQTVDFMFAAIVAAAEQSLGWLFLDDIPGLVTAYHRLASRKQQSIADISLNLMPGEIYDTVRHRINSRQDLFEVVQKQRYNSDNEAFRNTYAFRRRWPAAVASAASPTSTSSFTTTAEYLDDLIDLNFDENPPASDESTVTQATASSSATETENLK